jgi:hypothetical protein
MRPTIPPPRGPAGPIISEEAKTMLRHFRDNKIGQLLYEYPDVLRRLYVDARDCERAQLELNRLGFLELGPGVPSHIPVANRVRAAALTLEGERFIADGGLGD